MGNRDKNAEIARETLEILERGYYKNDKGKVVDLKENIGHSIRNSKLYTPEMLDRLVESSNLKPPSDIKTITAVTNETSLAAAKKLLEEGYKNVACLNFASAKNPGGGFINGAEAQEESLARSSALYPCISQMKEMYETNSRCRTALYTDNMIFSPKVPVFRGGKGELIEACYNVSFITAPAVNAKIVRERESKENIQSIDKVMIDRIRKILLVAHGEKQEALVLGAFGCGVFGNDPYKVASYFKGLIYGEGDFKNIFSKIVFAVYDNSKDHNNIKTFQHVL